MSYLCEGLDVIVVLEAHHVAASLRVRRNFNFFFCLFFPALPSDAPRFGGEFAPCMEGLRFGAPQAQTGRVMGMQNPQGPPIDPPGSLMYIYVALACLLVLARSPAILVTAFSSRSRRLVRRPRLPIPPRPHARPGALDPATIPPLCSLRLYRDPGI